MHMSRVQTIAAIAVLALLVLGAPVLAADDEPLRVWFLTWLWSDELHEMADRFTQETGIELSVEWVDPEVLTERLTLAVAGGVAPDVVQVTTARTYGQDSLLLPLNGYIERSLAMSWDDFFGAPAEWSYHEATGTIYGIPFTTDARILGWNKRLFREAGLNENAPPQTWDDFLETIRRLTRWDAEGNLEKAGFDFGGEGQWFPIYLGVAGGELWDYSVEPPTALPDLEPAIKAFRFGLDVINLLGGWPAYDTYVQATPEPLTRFQDRTAMLVFGSPVGRTIQSQFPDLEVGYTWVPIDRDGGKRYSLSGGYQFAIPVGAKKPDLGWQFIEWFVEPANLADYTSRTGWIPPRFSALPEYEIPTWMDAVVLEIAQAGRAWPESYGATYEYQTAFMEVLSGQTTPEAAAMQLKESLQVAANRHYIR